MKIKKLVQPIAFHKCCAKLSLSTLEFWGNRPRPGNKKGSPNCQNTATYKINGMYFCKKHAGLYLVDKYAE